MRRDRVAKLIGIPHARLVLPYMVPVFSSHACMRLWGTAQSLYPKAIMSKGLVPAPFSGLLRMGITSTSDHYTPKLVQRAGMVTIAPGATSVLARAKEFGGR